MSEHPYREFVESMNKREQELTGELSRLRERATIAEIDLRGTKGALELVSEQANELESKNSRLRDLVREMREALNFYGQNIFRRVSNGDLCVQTPIDHDCGDRARSAIAKADAALKESGEPVKYGCYADAATGEIYLDCIEEHCSQVRDGNVEGRHNCKYWRPIK